MELFGLILFLVNEVKYSGILEFRFVNWVKPMNRKDHI